MKSLCINNSFCCQLYHPHFSSSHRTAGYHGKKEFYEIQVTTDHHLKTGIQYSTGANGLMWYSVYNKENI